MESPGFAPGYPRCKRGALLNKLRPRLEIWHDGQGSRLHKTVLETVALLSRATVIGRRAATNITYLDVSRGDAKFYVGRKLCLQSETPGQRSWICR